MKRIFLPLLALVLLGALSVGTSAVLARHGADDDGTAACSAVRGGETESGDDRTARAARNGADDDIEGTAEDDHRHGHDGNDDMRGEGGDDDLCGDRGDDNLHGGRGDDNLHGGSGD